MTYKALTFASFTGLTIAASTPSVASTQQEIADLKRRIAALESQEQQQTHDQTIRWSGALELEANYTDNYNNKSESDLVVATAFFSAEAQIHSNAIATMTLLHEEDDTELEVDEAFISYGINDQIAITVGQIYLPFGQYHTASVSDPLTLEIGEGRETTAMLSYEKGSMTANAYIFNGDTDINGDVIDNWGGRVSFNIGEENAASTVSIDFISNMLDSNAIEDSGADFDENIEGLSASIVWDAGTWGATAEWITALSDIDENIISTNGQDTEPNALHLEAYFNSTFAGYNATYSGSIHHTKDALFLELPEMRVAASVSLAITDSVALSAEVFRDSDYDISDSSGGVDGTGEDAITLLFQLATEF